MNSASASELPTGNVLLQSSEQSTNSAGETEQSVLPRRSSPGEVASPVLSRGTDDGGGTLRPEDSSAPGPISINACQPPLPDASAGADPILSAVAAGLFLRSTGSGELQPSHSLDETARPCSVDVVEMLTQLSSVQGALPAPPSQAIRLPQLQPGYLPTSKLLAPLHQQAPPRRSKSDRVSASTRSPRHTNRGQPVRLQPLPPQQKQQQQQVGKVTQVLLGFAGGPSPLPPLHPPRRKN
jgi:hypothetical protein